jgi:hypothetical protein
MTVLAILGVIVLTLLAAALRVAGRVLMDEGHYRPGRRCGLLAAGFLALAVAGAATVVLAQEQPGHSRWHHYYRHWKQPGTETSCCNARIVSPLGIETGDCEPVRAELRQGDWFAWERHLGAWLRIPDGKVLRERNPSGEEGHLCWTPASGVLCFVPPDTGG